MNSNEAYVSECEAVSNTKSEKVKVKVRILDIALLICEDSEQQHLQSCKWQLIGMS